MSDLNVPPVRRISTVQVRAQRTGAVREIGTCPCCRESRRLYLRATGEQWCAECFLDDVVTSVMTEP